MFKPDLSDLGFIPVVATNAETASEFRSLFAGSFIAYAYLLVRYAFSFNAISIAQTIAYIMSFIAFGRLVSFFYDELLLKLSLKILHQKIQINQINSCLRNRSLQVFQRQ